MGFVCVCVWGSYGTVGGRNPASVFFRQPSLPTLNFYMEDPKIVIRATWRMTGILDDLYVLSTLKLEVQGELDR